eukprot:1066280_1
MFSPLLFLALVSLVSLSRGGTWPSSWSINIGKIPYHGCVFNLSDTNGISAEYDLNWFNLKNDVWRVIDAQNEYFEYVFNICGELLPSVFTNNATIPTACVHPQTDHGPCIEITDAEDAKSVPKCDVSTGGYEPTVGKVPSAIQIDTLNSNDTRCYWLGMEVNKSDDLPEYNMKLLDPHDAGKGVTFTILNGEWCESVGRNRELRIELECPDDARIEFVPPNAPQMHTEEVAVEEIDTCIYRLAVQSPNACPNRCVSRLNSEMFAVCATHGICEADPYGDGKDDYPNGTLRCLCDDGYTGSRCEQSYNEIRIINQNHPGLFTAIVICIILLGVAIVLAAVLCHKIRMRELVSSDSMHHLAGGMLSDENEAAIAKRKAEAVSMDIGSGMPAAVQLQTVDDQMEKDKAEDHRSAFLVDDEEEEQQIVAEQKEEEEEVESQGKDEDAIAGDDIMDKIPEVVGDGVGVVVDDDDESDDGNDQVGQEEETTEQAQQEEQADKE